MTGFSLDFNNTFEGGQVEDGTYEVIIERANEDATPSGAEFTNFQMVIRNDIEQKHRNMKVWERVWKAKATGKYNMMMFNTIGKAAQLQSGKSYQNIDELLADYEGKALKVTVKNEKSEYNGKTYENLNVKKWENTEFPNIQHQFKDANNTGGQAPQAGQTPIDNTQVAAEDLPF